MNDRHSLDDQASFYVRSPYDESGIAEVIPVPDWQTADALYAARDGYYKRYRSEDTRHNGRKVPIAPDQLAFCLREYSTRFPLPHWEAFHEIARIYADARIRNGKRKLTEEAGSDGATESEIVEGEEESDSSASEQDGGDLKCDEEKGAGSMHTKGAETRQQYVGRLVARDDDKEHELKHKALGTRKKDETKRKSAPQDERRTETKHRWFWKRHELCRLLYDVRMWTLITVILSNCVQQRRFLGIAWLFSLLYCTHLEKSSGPKLQVIFA
ncbi:Lysophospholipase 2 [Elsinoe australis]|uniref:Lysophospholipase 2 n=1 Tax=Elsinoe australis TaxID=40998 RepID=A0A2P7Z660_9PEZI|nr:Lysophospholipase 2 [Elsinoe australis]